MSDRGTAWSVTLNMKNVSRETCEAQIERAKSCGWGIQGQIEEGKEGTPHYQLLVKTPQVRFSALKRVFASAHIEKARNVKALATYCNKVEGRLEEFKTIERNFVQFPEVRKKFFEWIIQEGYEQVSDYDRKLTLWDEFIGLSIRERIECDVIGVNPQYRSIIQRYWNDYVFVAEEDRQDDAADRQTDRQTAEINVAEDILNADGQQESSEEGASEQSFSVSNEEDEETEASSIRSVSESSSHHEERSRNKGRRRVTLQLFNRRP